MEEDPRIKRFQRKMEVELSDLNATQTGKILPVDIERLSKIILDDSDLINYLMSEDNIITTLEEMTLNRKLTAADLEMFTKGIASVAGKSLFFDYLRALRSFSDRDYEGCIDIITGRSDFLNYPQCRNLLKLSCHEAGSYTKAAFYLASSGVYDELIFEGFKKEHPDDKTLDDFYDTISKQKNTNDICSLYRILSDLRRSDRILMELCRCYLEVGDNEKSKQIIPKINFEDFSERNSFKDFITIALKSEQYNQAYRASKIATGLYPDDRRIMLLYADSLNGVGRTDEAVEYVEQMLKKYPDFTDAIKYLIDLFYSKGDYANFLRYSATIKDSLVQDVQWRIKIINAEINQSDFDNAKRDIISAENAYPSNPEILSLKLDFQMLINDANGAFTTAREIFRMDRNDRRARDFLFYELFSKQDYEELLRDIEEFGRDDDYLHLKIASLIYMGRINDAITAGRRDKSIFQDDVVLDSIFFTVRDDSSIKSIVEVSGDDSGLLSVVIKSIRGSRIVWREELWNSVISSNSVAIAWIASKSTVNFRDGVRPDVLTSFVSKQAFNVVNNLVDAIFLIYSGKFSEDMKDSRKFMYPITEALLETGNTELAEKKLQEAYDPRNPDPFFYYMDAYVLFREGNYSQSLKMLSRALENLSNSSFLILKIRNFLKLDDLDSALETVDNVDALDAIGSLCYSDLYNYIEEKKEPAIRNRIIEKMKSLGVKNIWIERMERDKYSEEKNYDDAVRVSRIIVMSKSKTAGDVLTHAEILKASSKDNERLQFLESVEKETSDFKIDIWIADSKYLRKEYKEAVEYYRKAIEKGCQIQEIINYPDALIAGGFYYEAEAVIRSLPDPVLYLVKLYHSTSRIDDLVILLSSLEYEKRSEIEAFQYASEALWVNRKVRDTLVNIFYHTENPTLGKIISQRLLESRDLISAEKIMRALMKAYPKDIDNMRSLASLLYETNHPIEALNLLGKAVKAASDSDQRSSALDLMAQIMYETGDFNGLKKLYSGNTKMLNQKNLQWIIRSLIETYEFDQADQLMGQFHGNILPDDVFKELVEEMNTKKEFLRLQSYAAKIFDVEYKLGKVLTADEIVYQADIPLNVVEEVYHFIDSESYYIEEDEPSYEIITRDLFKRIVRKTNIDNIIYVKINIIYHNLPRKDVILAKNIYIYIKKCLRKRRSPLLNDKRINSLLKSALKMNLRREPLEVAYNLNIGMDEAMDVITLIEYVRNLDG
ncbi:MAG: tetratricopeptide repeat protein [Candidatus Thermoplasmatota archaeon]|nr:tetratricopeptide repeat protein [Candidatus Thermoplasmatota archaeon]MCL5666107.1 tetratricopeptide repeat protein [Candidatus Thermoplasmatota archaeon]